MTNESTHRQYAVEEYRVTSEPYYEPLNDEVALFEAAYAEKIPVLLKGPTGCGKTRFVEYMAYNLCRPGPGMRNSADAPQNGAEAGSAPGVRPDVVEGTATGMAPAQSSWPPHWPKSAGQDAQSSPRSHTPSPQELGRHSLHSAVHKPCSLEAPQPGLNP